MQNLNLLRLLLPLLLMLSASCSSIPRDPAASGNPALVDADNGLPDAQLAAPLESFTGLELTEDSGSFLSFKRPSDRLKFGRWPVDSITYNFYQKKLYSIQINFSDEKATKNILNDLLARYGEHTNLMRREFPDANAALIVREWSGQRAEVVLKYSSTFTGGQLVFLERETWLKLDRPRQMEKKIFDEAMSGSIMNLDFD